MMEAESVKLRVLLSACIIASRDDPGRPSVSLSRLKKHAPLDSLTHGSVCVCMQAECIIG